MRGFWAILLTLACLASAGATYAQGTVQQAGAVTPGHLPVWAGNGVVSDAGTPAAPLVSSLGLWNGAACPFGVSSQTGAGQSLVPYGQVEICQTTAATTFVIQGVNGNATPAVYFSIGGTLYPFPGSGSGNVTGPVSSIDSDLACFNGVGGTVLKDCGGSFASPLALGSSTPAAGTFTALGSTTSGSFTGTSLPTQAAGKLGVTGQASAPTLAANGEGDVYLGSTVGGLTLIGKGSSNDLSLLNSAGSTVCQVPTGATYLSCPGSGFSGALGGTGAAAASVTTLTASSTVSGAGVTALFASPPAIGGTSSAAGSFTTLAASSTVSGAGFSTYLASPPAIGGTVAAPGSFTNLTATTTLKIGAGPTMLCSATAPTVTSAGTSPSVLDNNGSCSFTVNVGTGGTANAIVLGLPAATTGWTCTGSDVTTQSTSVFLQKQTVASTTAATITNYNTAGAATAFVASDHVRVACYAD